jgi:hypothetical protein
MDRREVICRVPIIDLPVCRAILLARSVLIMVAADADGQLNELNIRLV